jgi:hypothetical protein
VMNVLQELYFAYLLSTFLLLSYKAEHISTIRQSFNCLFQYPVDQKSRATKARGIRSFPAAEMSGQDQYYLVGIIGGENKKEE